jgi:ADP-L-glycero-D-manno-heptose 6-epimerase
MRALITGGTGFIGSNLTNALIQQGYEVIITGHDAEQKLQCSSIKILQPSFIGLNWDAIGSVDVVFHQAAINNTTLNDRDEMCRANVDSSIRLFDEMLARGCKRFVYASSTAVYGNGDVPYQEAQELNPLNPYAESKMLFEAHANKLAAAHTDIIIVGLRYCNVYGPGEEHKGSRASMIYQLAAQMLKGNPRLFKYGEQKRDYIYVKDVVEANLLASKANKSTIVNCGSGVATEFNSLVEILNKALNINRIPEYIDNPYKLNYQSYTKCDMTQAKELINFVPQYGIEQGIEEYIKYLFP